MMSVEDTFDKVSEFIDAELRASLKDYEFIAKLNNITTSTFQDYMVVAEKIADNVNRINDHQNSKARLEGLVQMIDNVDKKIKSLETLAYKIDSYSRRLEQTYEKLQQSPN